MTHCLACGALLVGRCDKRFCDDACRSGFHNKKQHQHNRAVSRVNRILQKNRKILEECYARGKTLIPKQTLQTQGFIFGYCTFAELIKGTGHIRYCYEYGCRPKGKSYIQIIKSGSEIVS